MTWRRLKERPGPVGAGVVELKRGGARRGRWRAVVMGQIIPGVPVWRTGAESRLPGLAYVVFPGNVGGNDALVVVHEKFRQS